MNIQKQVFFFCFLLSINLSFGCGNKDAVLLTVSAKEYSNKTIKINTPYFTDSIVLNEIGSGKGKFIIPHETFAFLTISNGNSSFGKVLLLAKGYDLKIDVLGGEFNFTGKGQEANIVFSICDKYWEKAIVEINSFVDKTNSIDSIIDFYNFKEIEFEGFYKTLINTHHLSKIEEGLIRSNFLAKSLSRKQDFETMYFTFEEADSIKMNDRFGFTNSPVFVDSVLIKAGSADLMNFLSWNFDFRIRHDLSFKELGERRYALAIDSIISNDSRYGWRVKEYLYYHNINSTIYHFGVTKEVEILMTKLDENYPKSRYIKLLTDLGNKYDQLAVGKPAPDFSVETREGETVNIKDLKGKVLFIDVWATWCAPCLKKMPTILKYQEEFKEIQFVFLSIDNDKNRWESFLKAHSEYEKSLNYISGKSNFESLYRISSIPRYILIDKSGKIINAFTPNDDSIIHDTLLQVSK